MNLTQYPTRGMQNRNVDILCKKDKKVERLFQLRERPEMFCKDHLLGSTRKANATFASTAEALCGPVLSWRVCLRMVFLISLRHASPRYKRGRTYDQTFTDEILLVVGAFVLKLLVPFIGRPLCRRQFNQQDLLLFSIWALGCNPPLPPAAASPASELLSFSRNAVLRMALQT